MEQGLSPSEPRVGGDHSLQIWIEDTDGNPIEFHQFTPESKQLRR